MRSASQSGRAMFEGFQELHVDVDGVTIACVKGGAGPPVLLLHGFPQTKAMWARVAAHLARDYTVVAADLRGYGASDKPKCAPDASNYSFRAMAEDQRGLMRALGYERFHGIGHDRGGRVLHRLALDHPEILLSLAVLDIVPTYTMLMHTNRHVAAAYWHWYFLAQPEPFPETLIARDPDFFYETCMAGWGATRISDFNADQLADYRAAWRDPAMIHGSCSDYRPALTIDLAHDCADIGRTVGCPSLVLYGAQGVMASLYNIPAEWATRLSDMRSAAIAGGHYFIDQFPDDTATLLREHLTGAA